MNLKTVAKFINADISALHNTLPDTEVTGFGIDSRSVTTGEVFFALAQPDYQNHGFNGDFADAHEFVPDAFAQGAVAAVVRADKVAEHAFLREFNGRLLTVPDSILALQDLATNIYQNWAKPVIGITGSAGKTTAREMTAAIFKASGRRALSNEKNYNNGLGHPLTVIRLITEGEYDIAVLEMGMSTPMHEIRRLCEITPPEIGVVLNVLPVHLEHLGTIEAITDAKAELIESLKPNGTAILNADDERVAAMRERLTNKKVLTFGLNSGADVTAKNINAVSFGETRFLLVTPHGEVETKINLSGTHNIVNALAAAAAAVAFGVRLEQISTGLSQVQPPPMRGEILRFQDGFEVINDSYNSNPDALLSTVQNLLANGTHAARKIVVAGEMLELGREAEKIHFETGKKIAESGVDAVFGVRGWAAKLVDGAQSGGVADARFFADSDAAASEIAEIVRPGDVLLIKGSRGVRCEKIVEKLREKFELKQD